MISSVVSNPLTKPSEKVGGNAQPSPSSPASPVVRLIPQPARAPAPSRFTSISDRIKASEQNPRRAKALADARAELGKDIQVMEGRSIRARRLELGYSQTKLAELIGTSQSHVARIESGKGTDNLYFNTCRRLGEALQIDMNTVDVLLRAQEKIASNKAR